MTFAAQEANVQAAKQQAAQQAAKAKAAAQAKVAAAAKLKAAAQAKAAARSKAFAQAKAAAAVKAKAVAKAKARAKAAAKPYTIYDSVTPSSIPSGKAAAVYANGAYAASSAQTAGHGSVLWIDTNGSDPAANVLDVEPGDATPAGAAQWVKQRLTHQPKSVAIVYTMRSDWQQVKDNVAALPGWMQSKVRYWIADPTGITARRAWLQRHPVVLGQQLRRHDREPELRQLAEPGSRPLSRSSRVPPSPHGGTRPGHLPYRQHHRPGCAMLSTRRSNSAATTEHCPFSSVGRASPW